MVFLYKFNFRGLLLPDLMNFSTLTWKRFKADLQGTYSVPIFRLNCASNWRTALQIIPVICFWTFWPLGDSLAGGRNFFLRHTILTLTKIFKFGNFISSGFRDIGKKRALARKKTKKRKRKKGCCYMSLFTAETGHNND